MRGDKIEIFEVNVWIRGIWALGIIHTNELFWWNERLIFGKASNLHGIIKKSGYRAQNCRFSSKFFYKGLIFKRHSFHSKNLRNYHPRTLHFRPSSYSTQFFLKFFLFIPKKVHLWAHIFEQISKRTFNLIHEILFHIISIIKWKISCIQIIFETTHTHLPVKRLIK